jgi:hypothetical protein
MPDLNTYNQWDAATNYFGTEYVFWLGHNYVSGAASLNKEPGVAGNELFWVLIPARMDSPEALGIPTFNPLQRNNAREPKIAIENAATALKIYDELTDIKCETIFLQNLSTTALKVAWNQDCGEDGFHEVLTGCTAQDDGLGGFVTLDVRARGIKSISLYCGAAAIRCSVIKFERNQHAQLLGI